MCVWACRVVYSMAGRKQYKRNPPLPFSCCYRRRRRRLRRTPLPPLCIRYLFIFSALICIGMPSNRQITSLFGTHVPVTWKAKTHIEGRAHTTSSKRRRRMKHWNIYKCLMIAMWCLMCILCKLCTGKYLKGNLCFCYTSSVRAFVRR